MDISLALFLPFVESATVMNRFNVSLFHQRVGNDDEWEGWGKMQTIMTSFSASKSVAFCFHHCTQRGLVHSAHPKVIFEFDTKCCGLIETGSLNLLNMWFLYHWYMVTTLPNTHAHIGTPPHPPPVSPPPIYIPSSLLPSHLLNNKKDLCLCVCVCVCNAAAESACPLSGTVPTLKKKSCFSFQTPSTLGVAFRQSARLRERGDEDRRGAFRRYLIRIHLTRPSCDQDSFHFTRGH